MGNLLLSKKDVEILNSKKGLRKLFTGEDFDYRNAIHLTQYDIELRALHEELIKSITC